MILRAAYALLAPGVVHRDVRIEIDGNRIISVESGARPGALKPDLDLGLAVVMPGLVNAHCHLELEFCGGNVPYNGSFISWLQSVRDMKKPHHGSVTRFPKSSTDCFAGKRLYNSH